MKRIRAMCGRGRTRLNKFLAHAGVASRRKADRLMEAGEVLVNGEPATVGHVVETGDVVEVCGRRLVVGEAALERRIHLLYNKPPGVLCSVVDPFGRPTVISRLPPPWRVFRMYPVGRLDMASRGLLLVTNDGELTRALLHPSSKVEKEYEVLVSRRLARRELRRLGCGIPLDGRPTLPIEVEGIGRRAGGWLYRMVLREGRNRQIRRMMAFFGAQVLDLRRVRMGPLRLGRLPEGAWRELDESEAAALRAASGAEAPR